MRLLALALLTVLNEDDPPTASGLWQPVFEALQVLCDRYDKWFSEALGAAGQYGDAWSEKPLAGLVVLLAGFGAVAGERGRPAITSLGRWATGHLADGLAGPADPGLPAGEMIAEAAGFSDEEQQDHFAEGWLAGREPVQAAREILAAAEGMSPLRRIVAVRLVEALDDDALPAWREAASARCVGPFARAVLAAWDQGPEPSDTDGFWLAVEGAAAALEEKGPDEALSRVWESMPGADLDDRLAAVRATGHPDADALATAVADFAGSGAPRGIDQVAQLKVSLAGFRPAIWRRVLIPATATLGDLHVVVQILFGWDGDLVDFACSPRLQRSLGAAMREAGLEELEGAIGGLGSWAEPSRLARWPGPGSPWPLDHLAPHRPHQHRGVGRRAARYAGKRHDMPASATTCRRAPRHAGERYDTGRGCPSHAV